MAACLAEVLRAELVKEVNASPFFSILINPRPEGYGSRFVVPSVCPPRYREQHSLLRAS